LYKEVYAVMTPLVDTIFQPGEAEPTLTVRLTAAEVAVLPAASYAFAVQLCVPLLALVKVQA
jgi:hypothetical protein